MGHTIQHRGVVERVEGDRVFVAVEQQSACAGCHAKGMCSAGSAEKRTIEVRTPHASTYEVDERVVVALQQASMGLSSVVWGYVMPLVVLLVVLVGAKIAGVDDGPAAVATLVGVAIYYVGLYLARRRFDRVIKFTIIKE